MAEMVDLRAVARRALFADHRQAGQIVWIEGQGGSMRPLIGPGTLLLVEFGVQPSRPGEIVLFLGADGGFVVHRFVARRVRDGELRYVTKGDAAPLADPPLDPGAIYGVVRAIRAGASGPVRPLGGGWRDRLVAWLSWWSGRAAWAGRRIVGRAPLMLRSAGWRAIGTLAPLPVQVVAGFIPRAIGEPHPKGGDLY